MPTRKLILLFLLLLSLVACGQQEPAPAGTTAPLAPTTDPNTVALATTAPTATLPPPSTAIIAAPASPTPVATDNPAGEPATTPAADILLLTPEDFGQNRNRLTGELVDDPAVLQRRPIAVKISNAPANYVRPQSGLSDADLVFEHVTEGPITRFTAIIYGKTPPDMGPIRSARLIDVELPAMYDAALAYSGSSIGVANKLYSSEFRSRIIRSNDPGYYRTGADKPWEHTLYGTPAKFWESLTAVGENVAPTFTTQMAFSSQPPAGGSRPAKSASTTATGPSSSGATTPRPAATCAGPMASRTSMPTTTPKSAPPTWSSSSPPTS